MYRLYGFFEPAAMTQEELARCLALLPPDRREKALRYGQEIDRKTSAAAYLLLLYALQREYGLQSPAIAADARGKMYLPERPDIHVNISHCPLGCVCAAADHPVGVDIQDVRPYSRRLAARCCAESELRALNASDEPALLFTQMWAMKESFIKMTGEGLGRDVRTVDTTRLQDKIDTMIRGNCCIAVSDAANFENDPFIYRTELED